MIARILSGINAPGENASKLPIISSKKTPLALMFIVLPVDTNPMLSRLFPPPSWYIIIRLKYFFISYRHNILYQTLISNYVPRLSDPENTNILICVTLQKHMTLENSGRLREEALLS